MDAKHKIQLYIDMQFKSKHCSRNEFITLRIKCDAKECKLKREWTRYDG